MVQRKIVPPFAVVVGFVIALVSRVVNSRLAFGMWSSPWEAIMHGAMMGSLATFWIWPPRVPECTPEASRTMLRLATSLALVYACLAPKVLSATSSALSWQTFILFAYVPVFNFLLTFPLARLFARLRLDPTLPSSTALGPCALFSFFALMIPASVQSFRPGSPEHLRWILLGVPPLTGVLLVTHLFARRSGKKGWRWRELGALCWQSARLPFLFALGELGVIAGGVFGSG